MNRYFLFFGLIFLISCQPFNQQGASQMVTIQGTLNGYDTGTIIMTDPLDRNAASDTIQVTKGRFVWSGTVDSIKAVYLVIKDTPYDNGVHLFLEPGNVYVTGGKSSADIVQLSGTPENERLDSLNKVFDGLSKPLQGYGNAYAKAVQENDLATIDSLTQLYYKVSLQKKQALRNYIAQHGSSYATMFAMYNLYQYNPDGKSLQELYATLPPALQASPMGVKLKDRLDGALRTQIGGAAPDFILNDAKGNPVALSSLKGKYVLLDFWASWCVPCRFENKNLVKAYAGYKDKGFEILGLSIDTDRNAWQQAIAEDGLNWMHVIDQKARESEVYKLYTVGGIPMNFLIDKEGKIVGKGLRGKELETLLQQVL
ncbi:TlpA disulfide reductase family protein [uncultured Chitinophaga sp.]|uniref:TlpA disulfide reductase family protein n=1 Tax=uncultured Chitinophaga sp. TaxID=339340 RepID=UPI0025CDD1AE|nr:TlpA disulfide reductase family protein [uncultured Chitinophaga sp.]